MQGSLRSISAVSHAGEALRRRPLAFDAESGDPTLDVRDVQAAAGPEYRRDILAVTGGRAAARPLELRDDGILGRRHVDRRSRDLERFSPVELLDAELPRLPHDEIAVPTRVEIEDVELRSISKGLRGRDQVDVVFLRGQGPHECG